MLRQLRSADKLKKILWIGLLVLIIPSLVAFYGFGRGGSMDHGRPIIAATIKYPEGNEGKIGAAELRQAKAFLQEQAVRYAREQQIPLDQQAAGELATEKAVIDQAINLDILRHYGEIHNLTVTRDEVLASIQSQTTPEQRQMIYSQWQSQGRNPDSVIEELRQQREIQRTAESIGSQVRVSYYEAWQDYIKNNEQLVVDTYRVAPADFISSVTVTDAGLNEYYEKNKETFRVPDQVQYEYVIAQKSDLKTSITVTDDEITSYYASHKEDFRLPRKVEANQIFLKLPSAEEMRTTSVEAMTSITQQVAARANDLYERAAKGEAFATLADQFSEEDSFPPRVDAGTTATDANTTAGGYLGLLSEDVAKTWYGDQWTSAVFNAKEGALIRPVRTVNDGYAIIQVKKIVEGEIQPLDQVKPIIVNKLKDEKVEPIFEELGTQLQDISSNVTGLKQIADATSSTVKVSPKVNRGDKFIPGIGVLGDFEEAISDLQKGGHSDVLTDDQRHLVIQIKEEFPAHIPALAEIKGRVETAYKQKLAEEAAKKKAEEILQSSPNFDAFSKTLSDMGTTYTHSQPFKRPAAMSIFGGMVQDMDKTLAGAKKGDIRMATVGRPGQQQSYIIWHLAQVVEPSKTDFAKDLARISETLADKQRQILLLEYVRDQRAKLGDRIKIDEQYR